MDRTLLDCLVVDTQRRHAAIPAPSSLLHAARQASERRRRNGLRSLTSAHAPIVLAELRRASPRVGTLRDPFVIEELAAACVSGGATGLVVTTEPSLYAGDASWIAHARRAVPVPVLRRDLLLTPRQIAESALAGADGIVLYPAVIDDLDRLLDVADSYHLQVMLSLSPGERLTPSEASGRILSIDWAHATNQTGAPEDVLREQPASAMAVLSEGGLDAPHHVARLLSAGFDGIITGEVVMQSVRPDTTIRRLRSAAIQGLETNPNRTKR